MNHPGNAWLFATAHFIQVNSLPVRRIFNMEHFEAPMDEDLRGKAASDAMHGACGTIRTKFLAGVQKPSASTGRLLRSTDSISVWRSWLGASVVPLTAIYVGKCWRADQGRIFRRLKPLQD